MTTDVLNIEELLNILKLKQTAEDVFEGPSHDFVGPRIFGGQVLAQSLLAAAHTCDRLCHSLHAYFLRGGDISEPVEYRVERLRDGGTVQTREVRAFQKGKLIYVATLSFSYRENGLDYQTATKQAPDPETLPSEHQILHSIKDQIPKAFVKRAFRPRHVELKPTSVRNPFKPKPTEPKQAVYYRAHNPDQLRLRGRDHQAVLAFMSDFMLLGTALLPHGISFFSEPRLQAATIDHSLHFHREFYADQWLLYHMESASSSEGRGLADGEFWQDGKLVASTRQEGLIRVRKPKEA